MSSIHKVYWTTPEGSVYSYETSDMSDALECAADVRKAGNNFVTIASDFADMVGELGASGVTDGKLPNGDTYEWKKRRK